MKPKAEAKFNQQKYFDQEIDSFIVNICPKMWRARGRRQKESGKEGFLRVLGFDCMVKLFRE
jgi:hypothetical protein